MDFRDHTWVIRLGSKHPSLWGISPAQQFIYSCRTSWKDLKHVTNHFSTSAFSLQKYNVKCSYHENQIVEMPFVLCDTGPTTSNYHYCLCSRGDVVWYLSIRFF